MRRHRRDPLLWAGVAVAVVLLVVGAVVLRPRLFPPAQPLVAAAWLPVWDERAAASLGTALADGGVTEVSPTWATVALDGSLVTTPPPPEVLDQVTDGVRLLPTVQNFAEGEWQGRLVADLLADPARADAHRAALVDRALAEGWDGIDIDYEALPPTAGPQFTAFLTALRDDLHAEGLELTVAVPARESDEDPGTLAYSYQVIGQVADQVRVMAYDHSWSTSEAGPVAPAGWVRDVVDYAVERVPPEKLMLGLPTYGYDWVGARGVNVSATEAVSLADEVGAEPRWDDGAAAWTFRYQRDGEEHTVWYEDARSLERKQQIAVEEGLRGIAIWSLGGEDPQTWTSVAAATSTGVE
ncbi:glycosyl hydrolase family 18 protein [Geodermatophilus sp. DSM 45219]|uniref:glycosyl hydrolase family 18 protein n=1 Tax=Geodermatophilus sp. DSM 45219 TaxID=1881103 RepID=UPI000886A490|nr:glycosyl hydrolase family 18 protein [Geodermatophilus sp. DSM 45219]SDN54910.1 Glycosyl hydrolases family 18 [Geodermatophilus sp. DSM 45219]